MQLMNMETHHLLRPFCAFLMGLTVLPITSVSSLSAQESSPKAQEESAFYAEKSAPTPSAGDLILGARDSMLARTGLKLGPGNPHGAYIGWGEATLSVDPGNPAWGRSRIAAFDNALINAQSEFIRFQMNNILTESTRSIMEDDSYNWPKPPSEQPKETVSMVRQIFRKILAVQDEKLNRKLRDLGLDPESYEPGPLTTREDHFTQKLLQRTVSSAVGKLAGLITLQTFEGRDDKGLHKIGVIVVYSPNFRQFAHDMLHGTSRIDPKKAKTTPLLEQIGTAPATLSKQFGVRRVFDEKGMPVLVCFGQWSSLDRGGSERQQERRRDNAARIARSNADAALALFVNGGLNFSSETVTGEMIEEYTETTHNSDGSTFMTDAVDTGFLSVLNEQVKRRAQVTLSGIHDLHTWSYRHPEYDHEMIGVIRAWSPDAAEAADALRNFKPEDRSERTPAKKEVKTTEAKVESSGQAVDVADF
jgi:hypothetical protein